MKPWTRIGIKVMEQAGERIQDVLHKSNPWEGMHCGKKGRLPCSSFSKDEKLRYKDCTKRSVVYKTWCQTCRQKYEKENEKEDSEKLERLILKKKNCLLWKNLKIS